MKVAFSPEQGSVVVVDQPIPAIGEGEALIELSLCGLCGTDLMKVDTPNQRRPFQLGHEVVGRVAQVGSDVDLSSGLRVALAHHVPDYASHFARRGSETMDPHFQRSNIDPGGFAEFIRTPREHVRHTLLPLPDDLPDERAVFIEPLACCVRAVDRMRICEGDTAVVWGVGAAGVLFLPLLRDHGLEVHACDVRPSSLQSALAWGATATWNVREQDAVDGVKRATAGRGADCVILTVLNPPVWSAAMAAVRDGGEIVLFGVKPQTMLEADFWSLWRREVNVIASYSATPDGLHRALAVLRKPHWTLEESISHRVPLRDAAQAFELARTGAASKVVITRE